MNHMFSHSFLPGSGPSFYRTWILPLLLLCEIASASGPTPYPAAEQREAWPGVGPIRVFDWMTQNREYYWSQREQDHGALVFVGDSLTFGWKNLAGDFYGHKVANRGIGGDVTRGLLFRLQEDVIDLDPAAVVLLIGGNDLSAHADTAGIAQNIAAMIAMLHESKRELPILLCTIPPRDAPTAPTKPGAVEDVNNRIRKLAKETENVELLDLHEILQGPDGAFQAKYYEADRIHLGRWGYQEWRNAVRPFVESHAPKENTVPANEQWNAAWVDPETKSLDSEPYETDEAALVAPTLDRVPAGYELVFSDEFNGPAIDESKWLHRYIYNHGKLDHLNSELGRRKDSATTTAGNALTITATPAGDGTWQTGLCRSKWTFRYGFIETAAKFPANRGAWPSFWLNSGVEYPEKKFSRLGWPPEIDIFELVNNGREGPESITSFVHGKQAVGETTHSILDKWGNYRPGYSFADGRWHVVSCLWTPTESSTWVDGVKIVSRKYQWLYDDGTAAVPAHVLMDLAIGGNWPGEPTTDEPIVMKFDYVRIYQPADSAD